MALLHLWLPTDIFTKVALAITIVFCSIDVLRLRFPRLNDLATYRLRAIIRDCEQANYAGTTYLLAGFWVIYLIFPSEVVQLTLWMLATADPAASLVGKLFGKHKLLFGKSLEGFAAACAASALAGLVYGLSPAQSLLCGVIGGLSEVIQILQADDNFTFPIINASLLYLLLIGR